MKKYFLILFCTIAFAQDPNQMVTFTQAQSLGFSLNSGQSNVDSIECMTKDQALAKYNLDASAMSAYVSNQLVPRSVWIAGISNSISFSNLVSSGSNGSWSGTVTITGATATFKAFATSYSGGTLSTNITVGGNSRSVSRTGSGSNYSTTFTLPPGTYSYNFNVTASGGSGSAGINSYF